MPVLRFVMSALNAPKVDAWKIRGPCRVKFVRRWKSRFHHSHFFTLNQMSMPTTTTAMNAITT